VTEDPPAVPDQQRHERDLVGYDYFRARANLFFSKPARRPAVAVINATIARRFPPAESPIGKRFKVRRKRRSLGYGSRRRS
jgi:hypothetical protein